MKEKVMLVLIGGRSAIPAIVGALQFLDKIDKIKFLVCDGDNYQAFQQNAELALKEEKKQLICEDGDIKVVDPNNFDDVYNTIQEMCAGEELNFVNLTSVPQTMAFSVYSYVQNNHPSALIFSVNTDQQKVIPLVLQKQPISMNKELDVEKYVTACGLKVFKQNSLINNLSCTEIKEMEVVVNYFIEHNECSSKVLSTIRLNAGGSDSIKTPRSFSISEVNIARKGVSLTDLDEFFQTLKTNHIISRYDNSEREYKYRIEKAKDYAFLVGDWLELFVYFKSKQAGFYSVSLGVELANFAGEIDVFCMDKNNALICECKTGEFGTNDLAKLESKATRLGGNYCVKLLITNSSKISEECMNQAKNRRIVVVSGNQLLNIVDLLKKEMQNPTYPRR